MCNIATLFWSSSTTPTEPPTITSTRASALKSSTRSESKMLSLQSFPRKGVSVGHVGRIHNLGNLTSIIVTSSRWFSQPRRSSAGASLTRRSIPVTRWITSWGGKLECMVAHSSGTQQGAVASRPGPFCLDAAQSPCQQNNLNVFSRYRVFG